MRRTLKMLGGASVALVTVAAVTLSAAYLYVDHAANARLARTWPEVTGKDLPIPFPLTDAEIEALRQEKLTQLAATASADPAAPPPDPAAPPPDPLAGMDLQAIAMERAIARGEALSKGRAPCGDCHGKDGGGGLVVDAQPVWTWYAPNITRGGRTRDYTPADWDRIVRHGIRKDGTTATMPAIDFMSLSDQEVSDLAAYYQSLPPIDEPQPDIVLGPVGKLLLATGKMPLAAEQIDHGRTNPVLPPPAEVSLEFGAHVAATCMGCHRTDYTGGPIAQGPPDWPPARNLTQLQDYENADQLVVLLREAKKPDGTAVREPMSWMTRSQLTDVEIEAMFAFLKTLPPKPTGQ